jgi:hypothetical protein
MAVRLCRSAAESLLRRAQRDDILDIATDTIIMVVLLEYGRPSVAKNLVTFPFSEMTCELTGRLAVRLREVGRDVNNRSLSLTQARYWSIF